MSQFFRDQGGTLHEFPDDATPEEMAGAVERKPADAATKPQMGWAEYADNLVRRFASGATFGLADEIAAGANSVIPLTSEAKGGYSANLEAERAKDAGFGQQYPVAATTAEIGGGLATGLPGAAKVMTAKALTAIPKVVKAAAVGGAAGAATGFGTGEGGLGPRLQNAVIPGLAGAAGGAALPYVLAGTSKVLLPLMPGRLRGGPAKLSDLKIAQALERDKLTPAKAQAQLDMLGPDATLADVGGRGVGRLARGAAGASPTAEEMAASVFHGRQAGQGERVAGEAGRTISPNQDFYGTIDDLITSRRVAAAPLYEKAYQAGDIYSDQLASLAQRPSMKAALGRAYRIAAEEGRDPTQLGFVLDKEGNVQIGKTPTMQTWDYVKRGLDDGIEQFRDKVTGKLNLDEGGRADNTTRATLLNELDRLNPTYAQARAAFGGPSQSLDALALGRGIFGKDSEITAKRIAALSDGDKAFFRAGVVRALKDKVDSAPDGADAVKKIWGQPVLREKLQAAFSSAKAFMAFKQAMDRETVFYRTRANVLQGSRTAPMTQDTADVGVHPALPIAGDLATGNTGSAVARSLGLARDWLARPNTKVAEQLGPKLFTADPEANRAMLARLGKKPPPAATATGRRAAIAAVLAEEIARMQGGR